MNAEALAGFVPKRPPGPFGSIFQIINQAKMFAGEEATRQMMLGQHLAHWKRVREAWREAGRQADARHATTISVLTSLYRSPSMQSPDSPDIPAY